MEVGGGGYRGVCEARGLYQMGPQKIESRVRREREGEKILGRWTNREWEWAQNKMREMSTDLLPPFCLWPLSVCLPVSFRRGSGTKRSSECSAWNKSPRTRRFWADAGGGNAPSCFKEMCHNVSRRCNLSFSILFSKYTSNAKYLYCLAFLFCSTCSYIKWKCTSMQNISKKVCLFINLLLFLFLFGPTPSSHWEH